MNATAHDGPLSRDYTYEVYERLLDSALTNGYEILTVREYVSHDSHPERYVVMRHDVDRKPENALDMARIEAEAGVSATYYFRAIDKTFRPDLFEKIEDLGHEVGYHYEDVDTADGDVSAACTSFGDNLERFRQYVDVDTVAMHGNPLTPHDNREMWEAADPDDYGLLGEAYLSADFTDVVYFTDTNRTWIDEKTIVNDWPVGPASKPVEVDTTFDLMALLEAEQLPRLYLSAHPNRWAETYAEWMNEVAKDRIINFGKKGLWVVRSIRGSTEQGRNAGRS